ncbi:hypothetical protein [Dokdonella immobilis]|uniref:hypothetical protein n=1 Tax=Dokdonella immobilis TaxID=578942 RepID=UPI001587552D|nr:hypothetical protein [Dokdonella immobilis]
MKLSPGQHGGPGVWAESRRIRDQPPRTGDDPPTGTTVGHLQIDELQVIMAALANPRCRAGLGRMPAHAPSQRLLRRAVFFVAGRRAGCLTAFGTSPMTLFTGHTEKIGHFLQPTARAIGQSVIFCPL